MNSASAQGVPGLSSFARRKTPGGQVLRVEPGSPAEVAGLQAGDTILSINSHVLRDVIDYRFYSAEEELDIAFERTPGQVQVAHIERNYDQNVGLDFRTPTFDGIRRCRNQCDFCFVRQMPPGLRETLYVKDDDYRYSFLFGNFITLTNLQEDDWTRLEEQRLSPLYVSVQATQPKLRARILGLPAAPDILSQLERLGSLGIQVHAQIVIIPDLNDGQALERTIRDLASCRAVCSIGLVPIGITRYHSCGLRTVTGAEAAHIVAWARELQREFRRQRGVGLVYPSDELLLLANQAMPFAALKTLPFAALKTLPFAALKTLPFAALKTLPSARSYDGFPQLANGIGLTRLLLDDWKRASKRAATVHWTHHRVTMACGTLIAPIMEALAAEMASLLKTAVQVIAVPNVFFGTTVTVSGLLMAEDVVNALRGRDLGDLVVLPRAMFDAEGRWTLDNQTQGGIEQQIGVRMVLAERLSEVLQL